MATATHTKAKTVALPSGERVPALGMGTWHMGEHPALRAEEIATLRLGLDLGLNLIDTAEMYGNGRSEELVGEAIAGRRDDVFLVTKVLPQHATRAGTVAACAASLRRLGTDRIDLYLLHWRGPVSLEETLAGLFDLVNAGSIRYWGVSNFDLEDMDELVSVEGGSSVATDQVLYNLTRRGIEWDLLPWLRERNIPVMAYSPIEQARLAKHPQLGALARRWGMTPAQAALAWLLSPNDVIAIPKTSHRDRLRENAGALQYALTREQLAELDALFPPPDGPRPLEML
jgi:diketogulonate reductase-like aldo/keto reductase